MPSSVNSRSNSKRIGENQVHLSTDVVQSSLHKKRSWTWTTSGWPFVDKKRRRGWPFVAKKSLNKRPGTSSYHIRRNGKRHLSAYPTTRNRQGAACSTRRWIQQRRRFGTGRIAPATSWMDKRHDPEHPGSNRRGSRHPRLHVSTWMPAVWAPASCEQRWRLRGGELSLGHVTAKIPTTSCWHQGCVSRCGTRRWHVYPTYQEQAWEGLTRRRNIDRGDHSVPHQRQPWRSRTARPPARPLGVGGPLGVRRKTIWR